MKPKRPEKMHKICRDCYHYMACQAWNIGGLANTDSENCINYVPAADVRPVVHAKWILHENGSATCSHCKTRQMLIYDDDSYQHYCGNCGAQMEV